MQSFIDLHPLRLFVTIAVGLVILGTLVMRYGRPSSNRIPRIPWLALGVCGVATLYFFLEFIPYLTSPVALWPLEPQILSVSALAARGEQIYPDPTTDGAIYGQVYSPGVYLFYGAVFKIFGAGYLQAKAATGVALLGALACGALVSLRAPTTRLKIILTATLVCWIAYWGASVFGTRPEAMLLFGVGLAATSTVTGSPRRRLLLLALGTVITLLMKPTAFLYIAPFYVLALRDCGILRTVLTGALASATFFLPFLSPQVNFGSFQEFLTIASNFPFQLSHLSSLGQTMLITTIPFLLAAGYVLRGSLTSTPSERQFLTRSRVWWAATVTFLLCQLANAWIVLHLLSVTHHWAPFLFTTLVLFVAASPREPARQATSRLEIPWVALSICLTLVVTLSSYRNLSRETSPSTIESSQNIVNELESIMTKNPDKKIHVTWGGVVRDFGDHATAYRSALVFRGQPYLLEPTTTMERSFGGQDVNPVVASIIENSEIDIWLVPHGEEAMRFLSSYNSRQVLAESTVEFFNRHFEKTEESKYFRIYTRKIPPAL